MILRSNPTTGYTKVPTATLRDGGISYKALGVLCDLLAHPDNWEVSYRGAGSTLRTGHKSADLIRSALRELTQAGYYRTQRVRDASGRFTTRTWLSDVALSEAEWEAVTVRGFPEPGSPEPGSPEPGSPEPGSPQPGSPALLVSTGSASTREVRTREVRTREENDLSLDPCRPRTAGRRPTRERQDAAAEVDCLREAIARIESAGGLDPFVKERCGPGPAAAAAKIIDRLERELHAFRKGQRALSVLRLEEDPLWAASEGLVAEAARLIEVAKPQALAEERQRLAASVVAGVKI